MMTGCTNYAVCLQVGTSSLLYMQSIRLAKNSARLPAGAGEKTANRSPGATSAVTSRAEQPL